MGEYPPQFTMRLRDRRVQATYPVRLTCQVVGKPTPAIIWYKDGIEVTFDSKLYTQITLQFGVNIIFVFVIICVVDQRSIQKCQRRMFLFRDTLTRTAKWRDPFIFNRCRYRILFSYRLVPYMRTTHVLQKYILQDFPTINTHNKSLSAH